MAEVALEVIAVGLMFHLPQSTVVGMINSFTTRHPITFRETLATYWRTHRGIVGRLASTE